jgi:hypothetical protein
MQPSPLYIAPSLWLLFPCTLASIKMHKHIGQTWLLYTIRVLDFNVYKFVNFLFTNYELLTSPIGHGLLVLCGGS